MFDLEEAMGRYRCESIGVFYVQMPYGFDDDYDFRSSLIQHKSIKIIDFSQRFKYDYSVLVYLSESEV